RSQIADDLLWDSQFRRRATPEQVAWRRRNDRNVGCIVGDSGSDCLARKYAELSVENLGIVPGPVQQRLRVAVLQGQVRLPASEVDAALEGPGWIDERVFHQRIVSAGIGTRRGPAAA